MDMKLGIKRALLVEILFMVAALVVQLSITTESLFFDLVQNYQIWDGIAFKTLSDLAYLALICVVAVMATASISSSRSMLVSLAPAGRSGEFFGLYAIAGTITVWMGPLLVEYFTIWFNSQRIGMASISILFMLGVAILLTVHAPKNSTAADPALN